MFGMGEGPEGCCVHYEGCLERMCVYYGGRLVCVMRGVFRAGEGGCIMGEGWCVHYAGCF